MSIQPKWCSKILNGEKTIEVRKRFSIKRYYKWCENNETIPNLSTIEKIEEIAYMSDEKVIKMYGEKEYIELCIVSKI